MLSSELGLAHVDSLEAITDESAQKSADERKLVSRGVFGLLSVTSNAQSTAVLGAGWNKHVHEIANV